LVGLIGISIDQYLGIGNGCVGPSGWCIIGRPIQCSTNHYSNVGHLAVPACHSLAAIFGKIDSLATTTVYGSSIAEGSLLSTIDMHPKSAAISGDRNIVPSAVYRGSGTAHL